MPAIPVILAFLKGGLGWLWDFLSSHVGQLVLVGVVAWFWSAHRANEACKADADAFRASLQAARDAEIARQEQAATEIAAAATERYGEELSLTADLRRRLEDARKAEAHETVRIVNGKPQVIVSRRCSIDDAFIARVKDMDAVARRGRVRPHR